MHKNTTKCNKTQSKWCVNKHGASKIIDTFETYQVALELSIWNAEGAFLGVELYAEAAKFHKCLLEIVKESAVLLGFHHHVVYVHVDVSAYLLVQTSLHATLVCPTSIFQAEWPGNIAISPILG
jgi:hypothetical protein